MSLGGGMQLLLHGWLAVAWGSSLWMLTPLAATRILPKVLCAVPAGILCDRVSRTRILYVTRGLTVLASRLPLVGFFAAHPVIWILTASALAGTIHAVEAPASRATLGDISNPKDIQRVVALDRTGAQVSQLLGPAVAFGLASGLGEPVALLTSAGVLAAAALLSRGIPETRTRPANPRESGIGPLITYLKDTPAAVLLLLIGVGPVLIDRGIAFALPSRGGDGAAVGLALIAPELGGLLAAALLASARVRLGWAAMFGAAVFYALAVGIATQDVREGEVLIAALALTGVTKAGTARGGAGTPARHRA
jgi:MFS family permease